MTTKTKSKTLPKWTGMPLKLVEINDPKGHNLPKVFGITVKRIREVEDALKEFANGNHTKAEALIYVSTLCKHPNELAYFSAGLGMQFAKAALMSF